MQRASHSIPLQHKNARAFCELRIFFDHGRGPNTAGDLVQQDTICRQLTKAMRREVDLATINERLHACQEIGHCTISLRRRGIRHVAAAATHSLLRPPSVARLRAMSR